MTHSCLFNAVVLGASPTALYAVRELAQCGARVFLASDSSGGCARHSRHVSDSSRNMVGSASEIIDWTIEFAKQATEATILVPTSDVFIEEVCCRYAEIRRAAAIFGAYEDVAPKFLDKHRFYDLCKDHGVDTPKVWNVDSASELRQLSAQIPTPCLIKPKFIHRAKSGLSGRKLIHAKTQGELSDTLRWLPEDVGGWVVQELVPGCESNITLVANASDRQGRIIQQFSGRKLRQYPVGFGSASLVSSQRCVESEERSAHFLNKLGFRGICGAEFKRDERDGRLMLIEINPRPTLWFQVCHDAGIKLLQTASLNLLHGALPNDAQQDERVLWRYAIKDFLSRSRYAIRPGSCPFPAPDLRQVQPGMKKSWPVWRAGDISPLAGELRRYGTKLFSKS